MAITSRPAASGDILALLTSELVSNAVRHGGRNGLRSITVRVIDRANLRVEVLDEGAGFDPLDGSTDAAFGGWGLRLVDQLAAAWGVEREGARNKVWFELGR